MSVRKPIQVPEELKETMDSMQSDFRAKTSYELIEKLIDYYRRNEQQKKYDREKQDEDNRKRKATMVYLGEEVKEGYLHFSQNLGFEGESAGVQFLIEHYENSPSMDKQTFQRYQELLKQQGGLR